MPRSVNSVASRHRRKRVFKKAKGFFGRRKNVWTIAKNAVEKAGCYAYRDRKQKKRYFRKLWVQRINAASRSLGIPYSRFMHQLKEKNICLNRKMLADIVYNNIEDIKDIIGMKR